MKRFWKEAAVEPADSGWRVTLDGRPIRTRGGNAQVVPTQALATALAEEWRAQGEQVDPRGFPLRNLADYALDHVRPDRAATIAKLLPYAETDTLCYRADPDEALYRRQRELWEPLLTAFEARHGVRLERVSGVIHKPHPPLREPRSGRCRGRRLSGPSAQSGGQRGRGRSGGLGRLAAHELRKPRRRLERRQP